MKITVIKSVLIKVLTKLNIKKSAPGLLGYIKLTTVETTCQIEHVNPEITRLIMIDCQVEAAGRVLLPAHFVLAFLKKQPDVDNITVITADNELIILAGTATITLPLVDPIDYLSPPAPVDNADTLVVFYPDDYTMRDLLKHAYVKNVKDDNGYALDCIDIRPFRSNLILTTTNGYSILQSTVVCIDSVPNFQPVLLPATMADKITKMLEITNPICLTVCVKGTAGNLIMTITSQDVTIICRLSTGVFPNVNQFLEAEKMKNLRFASIKTCLFMNALQTLEVFNTDECKLTLSAERLTVSVCDKLQGTGSNTVPAATTSQIKTESYTYNLRNLLKHLKTVKTSILYIGFLGKTDFTVAGGFLYLKHGDHVFVQGPIVNHKKLEQ